MTAPLRTSITSDRQRYVDDAVMVEVSKAKTLVLVVNRELKWSRPLPPRLRWPLPPPGGEVARLRQDGPVILQGIYAVSHYMRSPLRWVTPDGRGGFQPRRAR